LDKQLLKQFDIVKNSTLLELFKHDTQRAQKFCVKTDEITLDYSKNHISDETLRALCHFAKEKNLPAAIKSLFNGCKVNNTEKRPALHTALRAPPNRSETSQLVQDALNKMSAFIKSIHQGQWQGFSGKVVNNIVNIGIGGSDLGPRMVTQALSAYHLPQIKVHFVANIDGADLEDTLAQLDPATTLFIVASKSFITLETLNNSLSARQWILDAGCLEHNLHKHFIAISSNIKAASEFGIAEDNIFPLWDWVGGRYSLWSTIGMPIALAIGMKSFRSFLDGAHQMDMHFAESSLKNNMPVIAALLSYWYSHFWGTTSHAVLPYAQRLSRLPAYLQQLDMESLGKSVSKNGISVNTPTGGVIWGTEGSNGQHSFHQLLHQGTHLIPVDFIAVKQSMSRYENQHQYLLACCISQAQALLQGKSLPQAEKELKEQGLPDDEIKALAPHKVVAGNKPSNMLLMEELSPRNLGALIAFYEHKVYTSSVLMGINAFDQWGVELGKQLGKPVYDALTTGQINHSWDASTRETIERLK
jgi:glucose-6-phosphate isomerase